MTQKIRSGWQQMLTGMVSAETSAVLFLILLTAFVSAPLLGSGVPLGVDSRFHLYRLVQLEAMWRAGIFFARWQPDLALGYGFPLFNYYAPAVYYYAGVWQWLGLSLLASYKLAWMSGAALAAVGTYGLLRQYLSRSAALFGATAFVASPFMLLEVAQRGGLPQFWANAVLPLCFWGVWRAARRDSRWSEATAVGVIGLMILSHHVVALLALPFLAAFALAVYGRWWRAIRPILLALTLTAFYWLPALGESGLVQIDRAVTMTYQFDAEFIDSWRDLIVTPLIYDARLLNLAFPLALSLPIVVAALGQTALIGRASGVLRWLTALGALALLVRLGLMLNASEPLWRAVPQLGLIQFPMRFLGVVTFMAAVLAASFVDRFGARVIGVLLVATLGWNVVWSITERQPAPPLTLADSVQYEIDFGLIGTTTTGEYLPLGVRELPSWDSAESALNKPIYETTAAVTVVDENHAPLRHDMRVRVSDSAEITFNTFNFAGWQATLNGQPQPLKTTEPHGLIAIELPPGEHQLSLYFGSTPLRRVGSTLSALTAALLLVGFAMPQAGSRPVDGGASTPAAWFLVGVLLLLTLLRLFAVDGWFDSRTRYDGTNVRGVTDVRHVRNEAGLELLGVALPPTAAADAVPEVALYWRAFRPIASDYGINLLLLDQNGQRVGGALKIHIADLPTSRWSLDRYARDVYKINIAAGTPPGDYQLVASVFPFDTPQSPVNWLDEAGNPSGSRYVIGTLALERARRSADSAALDGLARTDFALGDGLSLAAFRPITGSYQTGDRIPLELAIAASANVELVPPLTVAVGENRATLPLFGDAPPRAGDVWRARPILPLSPQLQSGTHLVTIFAQGAAIEIGTIEVRAPQHAMQAPPVVTLLSAEFDPVATLHGVTVESQIRSNGQINVTVVWQAQAETQTNYTSFVQLLDADGRFVVGSDQMPARFARPTTSWIAGEYIVDPHTLPVSAELPAGDYQIIIGLYDSTTLARLATPGGETFAAISLVVDR